MHYPDPEQNTEFHKNKVTILSTDCLLKTVFENKLSVLKIFEIVKMSFELEK